MESYYKALATLANTACQTLLFISVSLTMNNKGTLLLEPEQCCLTGNVGQFRQFLNMLILKYYLKHLLEANRCNVLRN